MSEVKTRRIVKDPAAEPTTLDKAKDILHSRQMAFIQTFSIEKNKYAKDVLDDLARFCRSQESTFHPDGRVHAVLEGRREVWLRIQAHLNLDPESLAKMYLKTKEF